MPAPFPFDAVLFDLDGTLVATDLFWVDAAAAGCRKAFTELGIARELPTAADWMGMVGQPIASAFDEVFADLLPGQRAVVQQHCLAEEFAAIEAGGGALLPGTAETLQELSAQGVRMGICSNCGRDYLEAMYRGLGLDRWIQEARCLDSPGIEDKTAMIAELLLVFDTRSAVFVGDRVMDRNAAWENGLPHVHLARGYAASGEEFDCEAVVPDLTQLIPRLLERCTFVERGLGVCGLPSQVARTVGVSGRDLSGRSLFARDAGRLLEQRGEPAVVVALEDYRQAGAGPPSADLPLGDFDLERLERELLLPRSRGTAARAPSGATIEPHVHMLLEGCFLWHPRLASRLDAVLYLDASEELVLRRAAGRDARYVGPDALRALREVRLPLERRVAERWNPLLLADGTLPADNVLGPLPAGGEA